MNNIIKFKPRKANGDSSHDPIMRMKSAVANMETSVAEILEEIAGFRAVIGTLDLAMKDLESSFKDYSHALGRIKVRRLRRRSLRLSGMMDSWPRPEHQPETTSFPYTHLPIPLSRECPLLIKSRHSATPS